MIHSSRNRSSSHHHSNRNQSMAGYDGSLIMTTPRSSDILRLSGPDTGHHHSILAGMDGFDHDPNFDSEVGSGLLDDVHNTQLPLPFTPSYELSDVFSTTFEDPFSYQSGPFESLLDESNQTHNNDTTTAPQDLDNKLLGFGAPILKAPILDDAGQTWPAMSAELYGMFFVAEDVFGDTNTGASSLRPMELTCYRRNLFQISGTVTLSRGIKSMINEQGQEVPLYDLMATISALESIEGKSTEIISVPWKTSAASSSEEKAGAAPPKWPLDLSMNPELDPSCVSIPIAWKRLQFKHATANNGRRKGLQQHYVIQINLTATAATGETVKLAEIQSGPIIVRGRSPRNFDSRKDVPLSERKGEVKARTGSDSTPSVKVDPGVTNSNYRFYALNQLQQPLDLPNWNNTPLLSPSLPSPSDPSPRPKKPTLAHQSSSTSSTSISNFTRPPIPKTRWNSTNSSDPTTNSKSATGNGAPIDLSLNDDEYGIGKATPAFGRVGGDVSPVLEKAAMSGKGRGGEGGKAGGVGSPENVELLYEYFPLSLDDWMPPVDAIYRPHVVHHTIVPPDLKAAQVKNKTKRYFSADD